MNDKFEDLLYNSGLTSHGCWDKLDEWDREAVLKFGELIVRECVDICFKHVVGSVGTYPGVNNNAVGSCIKNIKEHFGVK